MGARMRRAKRPPRKSLIEADSVTQLYKSVMRVANSEDYRCTSVISSSDTNDDWGISNATKELSRAVGIPAADNHFYLSLENPHCCCEILVLCRVL